MDISRPLQRPPSRACSFLFLQSWPSSQHHVPIIASKVPIWSLASSLMTRKEGLEWSCRFNQRRGDDMIVLLKDSRPLRAPEPTVIACTGVAWDTAAFYWICPGLIRMKWGCLLFWFRTMREVPSGYDEEVVSLLLVVMRTKMPSWRSSCCSQDTSTSCIYVWALLFSGTSQQQQEEDSAHCSWTSLYHEFQGRGGGGDDSNVISFYCLFHKRNVISVCTSFALRPARKILSCLRRIERERVMFLCAVSQVFVV